MTRHRQTSKALASQLDPNLPPSLELTHPDDCHVLRPPVFIPTSENPTPPVYRCPCSESRRAECAVRRFFEESVRPLEIDIGFGMGRFIIGHSQAFPENDIAGIEKETVRVAIVDVEARKRGIQNLRLIGGEALPFLQNCVPEQRVSAYFLFFPDPWPKKRHRRKRLFTEEFVNSVCKTLITGGRLCVSTDFKEYFESINALMAADKRFAKGAAYIRGESEQTDFEIRFKNKEIPIYSASWTKH